MWAYSVLNLIGISCLLYAKNRSSSHIPVFLILRCEGVSVPAHCRAAASHGAGALSTRLSGKVARQSM